MTQPIRILLVDDHALFRKGVASLLKPLEDMEVVGEASNSHEAVKKARELAPDLILMDIQMQDRDGLETTRLIKHEMPEVKIVMLTISGKDDDLFEAIKNGAQ
ncbi:MAG: response regulator transcription factor, partial [Anaerolineae bacterium]|nr:response regulator transcription factor [Anaerolineae bacterium]